MSDKQDFSDLDQFRPDNNQDPNDPSNMQGAQDLQLGAGQFDDSANLNNQAPPSTGGAGAAQGYSGNPGNIDGRRKPHVQHHRHHHKHGGRNNHKHHNNNNNQNRSKPNVRMPSSMQNRGSGGSGDNSADNSNSPNGANRNSGQNNGRGGANKRGAGAAGAGAAAGAAGANKQRGGANDPRNKYGPTSHGLQSYSRGPSFDKSSGTIYGPAHGVRVNHDPANDVPTDEQKDALNNPFGNPDDWKNGGKNGDSDGSGDDKDKDKDSPDSDKSDDKDSGKDAGDKDNKDGDSGDSDKDDDGQDSKDKDSDGQGDSDSSDGSGDSDSSDGSGDSDKDSSDKDKDDKSDDKSDGKDKDKDDGDSKGGLGGLADKLNPLKKLKNKLPGGKKKKFKDFLNAEKKKNAKKEQLNPLKKAKNLIQKILNALKRIFMLIRAYFAALRLWLLYKLVALLHTALSWVSSLFSVIGSVFGFVWAGLVGIATSIFGVTGGLLAAIVIAAAVVILGVVFAIAAIASWINDVNRENAMQNYYNECVQDKSSKSSDSSDSSSGGSSSTTSGKTFHIKIKDSKSHDISKVAREIAKAIANNSTFKKMGATPELIFGQMWQESGNLDNGWDSFNTVVKQDMNLSGLTGTYNGKYKTGSRHGENDGSYTHFTNWSDYASAYASTLYSMFMKMGGKVPKDAKTYVTKLKAAGYFTDNNVSGYIAGVQTGMAAYKHKTTGGAANATGGDTSEDDSDDSSDSKKDKCNLGDDDDNTDGDLYKEAHKWLGWFDYDMNRRTEIINGWKNPSKHTHADCSAFVWFVMKRCGYKVPAGGWNTVGMRADLRGAKQYLKPISSHNAKKGDILVVNQKGGGEGGNGHAMILAEDWHGKNTKVIEEGGDQNYHHVNIRTAAFALGNWFNGGYNFDWCRPASKHGKGTSGGGNKYSTHLSKSEKAAKEWIAQRESGGSYSARNGIMIGRYQLTNTYLHGDYSKKNQERTADRYVKQRYGSWRNAQKFWLANHWY